MPHSRGAPRCTKLFTARWLARDPCVRCRREISKADPRDLQRFARCCGDLFCGDFGMPQFAMRLDSARFCGLLARVNVFYVFNVGTYGTPVPA
jgi:hypothetical protein